MLRNLHIRNFKSIESMKINLKELNILIGPNNSGKTSLLQSMVLLKQSIDKLKFDGPLVNLGDFKEAVYLHDPRKLIQISFWLSAAMREKNLVKELKQTKTMGDFQLSRVQCSLTLRRGKIPVEKFIIRDAKGNVILQASGRGVIEKPYIFHNVGFSNPGFIPVATSGSSISIDEYGKLQQFIRNEFDKFLYYITSRRGTQRRFEPVDARYQSRPKDVGIYGENTIPVLAFIRDDVNYKEVNAKITQWLRRFGLEKVVAQIDKGPAYSLKVINSRNQIQSSILDVGFGLNQLLPVIVQCFYAPKGSLILIEQPEAHLHPRSQADVADFLVDVIDFGNRVIVETHSEHLLLRLQRRIAEKKVEVGKINVFYIDQTPQGTSKLDMKLDKNGYFIEPLPKEFFEEGFQEALAHLRASHPGSAETGQSN